VASRARLRTSAPRSARGPELCLFDGPHAEFGGLGLIQAAFGMARPSWRICVPTSRLSTNRRTQEA
jgi:hypothetical protein